MVAEALTEHELEAYRFTIENHPDSVSALMAARLLATIDELRAEVRALERLASDLDWEARGDSA